MVGLLISRIFNSQLMLGLVVGGLIGIGIGAYLVRRAVAEQYTSLPTSLPQPGSPEEKRRRPSPDLLGRPAAVASKAAAAVGSSAAKGVIAVAAAATGAGGGNAGAGTGGKAGGFRTVPEPNLSGALGAISIGAKSAKSGGAGSISSGGAYYSDEDDTAWLDAESGDEGPWTARSNRPRPAPGAGASASGFGTPAAASASGFVMSPSDSRQVSESCSHEMDMKNDVIRKDDPLMKHYKKGGMVGAFTSMFGDKKTLYCHHVTASGEFAVRAAGARTFSREEEVWAFLGKHCSGRFAYDSKRKALSCGKLVRGDHDKTCNPETCLFVKHGLKCPTPAWALK